MAAEMLETLVITEGDCKIHPNCVTVFSTDEKMLVVSRIVGV